MGFWGKETLFPLTKKNNFKKILFLMTITQLCSEPVPIQEGKGAIFLKSGNNKPKKESNQKNLGKDEKKHTHAQ